MVPRAGARALRLAYALVIALATLRGLEPSADVGAAVARLGRALAPNVRPSDAVDAARNVVLFAGFGAVWVATAAPGRLRRALLRVTLLGALLSATVEVAQLFSPVRWASVLDLATNTGGAFVGALAVALGVAVARARPRVALAPPPLALLAVPYAAACAFEAFSPFGRPDQVPAAWGGPGPRWAAAVAYLRAHPHTLGTWTDPLLFAPAGALALLLWAERGGRAWPGVTAVTAGLGLTWLGAEVARGVAGGDMAPWAVALRTLATLAGAVVAARALARPGDDAGIDAGTDAVGRVARVRAWLARYGLAAFAAVLLVWSWRPFGPVGSLAEVGSKLGRDALVPLRALAADYSLHSVADVAVSFQLYVPVGAWLAARSARSGGRARLRALWPGLVLALVAEAGQLFVAARTVDVTDVLVQAAGVFLGWAVVRQAMVLRAAPATGGGAAPAGGTGLVGRRERRGGRAELVGWG